MAGKIKGGEVGSVKALKKSLKKSAGGGQYLKHVPEDGINVRFLTEPDKWVEYFEHYDEDRPDGEKSFPCTEDCEGCAMGLRKSKRYLANALDLDDGNKVVPLKLPASLAGLLLKRYDKFETMMDRDYELSKEGSGLDTEYSEAYEAPSKRNVKKYEPLDLWAILESQIAGGDEDDDEDDEDEKPRKGKGGSSKGVVKKSKKPVDDDEDDEDDEDDDEDDEDDEDASPPKRVVKKKKPVKKAVSTKSVKKPIKKSIKKK